MTMLTNKLYIKHIQEKTQINKTNTGIDKTKTPFIDKKTQKNYRCLM